MTTPTYTWTPEEMITLAQRGCGRIVNQGYRGATLVTVEETVAMANCLLHFGLAPLSAEQAKATLKPPHQPIDGDNAL
jgi:hypothetical protein